MINSLRNSASGINTQQARLDTTANNMSGLNTDAYKSQRASFSDLLYSKISDSGRPVLPPGEKPLQGSGSREVLNIVNFEQGDLRETRRETDLSISGRGFFKIILPDGSAAYTRNGNFNINAERQLVTQDGDKFYPDIFIPEDSQEIMVDKNGKVRISDAQGNLTDLGDITIYGFVNPNGLKSLGKSLYAATDEAGTEEEGTPGEDGLGEVIQKHLESSNIDLASEMADMMESQRIYQMNARALKMADDMWGIANNLRK